MRVSEAFELYRTEVIVFRSQSSKTEEHHRVALKALLKITGDIEISELTFDMVRRWKERMEQENKSVQTIRGYLIKLRVVLDHLLKNGIKVLNPELIPLPKRVERPPSWITKEEVRLLIDSTRKLRNKAIISLLYASGLRVSEMCRLNRGDIRDCKFTVFGKGQKYRLAFVDKRTCMYLNAYLKTRKDHNPALFIQHVSGHRIEPSGVQEILRRVCTRSGLENVTPHTLRHSYATNLMEAGSHIYTIQRLLGHSSIQTTEKYLHVTDPKLQEEYEKYHTV